MNRAVVLALMCLFPLQSAQQLLPAGTELEIRLKSRVGSLVSRAGDPVEAVVIVPVIAGDEVLVPAGAVVRGTVREVLPVTEERERSILWTVFREVEDPGGGRTAFASMVVRVDNARETVDAGGRVVGIVASESLSARMDEGLERLGAGGAFGAILQGIKRAMVSEVNPEILYEPGTELTVRLLQDAPLQSEPRPLSSLGIEPVLPAEELFDLVNGQPFRTVTEGDARPSDVTNLMFLGTEEDVHEAFAQAGWTTAAELDRQSKLETFRAIAEQRGYKEAPMSVLLLDERSPDLTFQKQLNTFAARHHLRIWRRPGSFQGREVWVSSATHDTGIDFSAENRTFIHTIDPNIDRERAKVVFDLLFTGLVRGLSLVERPEVPRESENATGDELLTDGRMAVLRLGR